MIKGSTKVGEIFFCGKDSNGAFQVLPQYLGQSITGLGGGNSQLFVIQENEGFIGGQHAINQFQKYQQNDQYRNNTHDGNRPSGRKNQTLAHQKFGMTPFDQQNTQQIQNNFTLVDQKIEERESLRHSTNRSKRSERLMQPQQHNGAYQGFANAQVTATDNFDQTDYNISEKSQVVQNGHNYQKEPIDAHDDVDGDFQPYDQATAEMNYDANEENKNEFNQSSSRLRMQYQNAQQQMSLSRAQANQAGRLLQISCGAEHTLNLSREGEVYSFGSGNYCNVGQGGSNSHQNPQIIKSLSEKKVVQISCGESHSLVLTDKGYLYAWGRGFEGQLGLSDSIEIASVPRYVKFFHGKFVSQIAAGSFYSLAITDDGKMYSWGEARMGQLGIGKHNDVKTPALIQFPDGAKIKNCCAGFGHSMCLSQEGDLYSWGFNVYGQLGQNEQKNLWYPERILQDSNMQSMPPVIKIACSKYGSFAIDCNGVPYSWGKGYIGHQGESKICLPQQIIVPNRVFTNVFANHDCVLFYAPIRVYEIQPKCGPNKGGTKLKITGTGFAHTKKTKVRFAYGNKTLEVDSQYGNDGSIYCITPQFSENGGNLIGQCTISVTLDGTNYSECLEPFTIYSNDIFLTSINPKCGSVQGGTTVTLSIQIDEATAEKLSDLKIGFKSKVRGSTSRQVDDGVSKQSKSQAKEEDESDWICAEGFYENKQIIAKVPAVEIFDSENMVYQVDVAINGQQFTGKPVNFRYYDVRIEKLEPDYGPSSGGTNVLIVGNGLYDAAIKKVKFSTADGKTGNREVTADWDRNTKALKVTIPPYQWLFAEDATDEKTQRAIEKQKQKPLRLCISLNGQEWIDAMSFKYHETNVLRLAYPNLDPLGNQTPEMINKIWCEQEPEVILPEGITEEELKKREDEERKKAAEETEETQTTAKRRGAKLYIYGNGFLNDQNMMVLFSWGQGSVTKRTKPIYKNSKKLAVELPDMGSSVEIGNHQLVVEVTMNGQQFTQNNISFLYNHVDSNLTDEDLRKLEEEEAKVNKKGAKKK